MLKKYAEVSIDGRPVVVAEIRECEPLDFVKKKREAAENFQNLIGGLKQRIDNLEKEVRTLKGED